MRHFLLLTLFVFVCFAGLAQAKYDLKVEWDYMYAHQYPEVMHDFVMLDDGRVAVVGEVNMPGQKKDGFFALFEAGTFRRIMHKTFGQFREDVLTGLAYAGDQTFYLAGYTDTDNKGRQGWVIRIDAETGEVLFDKQFGDEKDDQFDKIVWLPEAGHGILAGRSGSLPSGYLWTAIADGDEVTILKNNIGDGIVGELVGMEKGPNCVWLSGYTQRVKNYTRSGDVWVFKLNTEGILAESPQIIRASAGQELFGMTGTMDGELYLAGKVGNANGDSDVWLAEVRPGQREAHTLTFGSDIQDCATSLFRTPGHSKWLVVRKTESRELTVQVYSDTIDQNYAAYEVTRNQDFYVNRILLIGPNLYLLAGTSYVGRSRTDGCVRLLCLRANENLRRKGIPEVQETNIRFDDNNNGKLAPGERGTLRFGLKNTSKETPILKGSIQVKLVAGLSGASVTLSPLNLGELPIGVERTFSVPVKADKTLESGQITLEFTVEANDRTVRTFQGVIVAEREAAVAVVAPPQADLSVTEPDMAGRDSRIIIATEGKANVTVRAFSGNQNLKSTDFKTRVNGQVRQDDKSPVDMKMLLTPRPNRFEYIFKQELMLKNGRNVVYFELEGERTDSIVFEFQPEKPNLHLLVIGVPQKDLNYTVKDARDFAKVMIGQRGVGFFNEVFVDTLTTADKTKVDEIVKSFARLEREFRINKRIKRNDYLVIFMSSHGIERKSDATFGFVASNYDPDYEELTTVSYQQMVEKYLNPINCKKIIFIDACHSGKGGGAEKVEGAKSDPMDLQRLEERIKAANAVTNGAATYFSCKADESSYEDPSWQNGAFTKAILEAFSGLPVKLAKDIPLITDTGAGIADLPLMSESFANDGLVAVGELDAFLQKRVPDLVKFKGAKVEQTPQFEIKTPMSRDITLFQILK